MAGVDSAMLSFSTMGRFGCEIALQFEHSSISSPLKSEGFKISFFQALVHWTKIRERGRNRTPSLAGTRQS
jgi:hypothetical protein